MSETQIVIPCLYLPIQGAKLLLPNVSVAEVVDYQKPKTLETKADYFLGMVPWRGIDVPLISYESANDGALAAPSTTARIAVINNIGTEHQRVPFFAILTQGIPRLVKVSEDLMKKSKTKKGKADSALVIVDGEDATIPDLDYLESLVCKQL